VGFPERLPGGMIGSAATRATRDQSDIVMSANVFCCHYSGSRTEPRYEMWREEFARRWLPGDFEPVTGSCFAVEASGTKHSFLDLCNMQATPLRIERRDDIVPDAAGYRFLVVASGSRLQACQRGRSIDLSFGQMVRMSADEPAQVTHLTEGDRWSIRISQKLLGEFCRSVDDKIACRIDAGGELTNLVLQQIKTAHRFGPKLDASANYTIAQHLLDLVGLCLGADRDAAHIAGHRGLAAARLEAIKSEILRGLGRSDMGLAQIALNHGLSTRYVQHLFELSGTSFTSFVLERRLLLAHRLLREPKSRWRKVSDVASAAGFSDISYFNRAFRARFGARPTDVRKGVD
jgi:AraC-like DNA-binding protein